jgi:hypothetical protein
MKPSTCICICQLSIVQIKYPKKTAHLSGQMSYPRWVMQLIMSVSGPYDGVGMSVRHHEGWQTLVKLWQCALINRGMDWNGRIRGVGNGC